jgi:tetratricopeptide (TPR) repeat protein
MISKSLQINQGAAKTYSMWAYIEYENKNIEKAKEILREGLKLNPENQTLQQNLTTLEKPQTAP